MVVTNLHKTINHIPFVLSSPKDSEKIKELNDSVVVAADETMIVVGILRIPDGMEILLDGDLILC